MKILIVANSPHCPTGYGVPIKNLVPYLKKAGHEIAIQAFFGIQGATLDWRGVTLYPGGGEAYGVDMIDAHCRDFQPNLVITLLDNWAFPDDYAQRLNGALWLQWFPIDGTPAPPRAVRMARRADYPAVFSQDGVQQMANAGVEVTYLPYGVNCDVFVPGDKEAARDALQLPQDKFIALTVAANKGFPARKAWPEIVQGFKLFHDQHPDSLLYLHTRRNPITKDGIFFDPLVAALGLGQGSVRFANQDDFAIGVANENLVTLYQAADVMLLPSMGEGFGLPIVEAQACGCPVITQACSSMTELTKYGVAIEPLQPFWFRGLDYWWQLPNINDIAQALYTIYVLWDRDSMPAQAQSGIDWMRENYHYPVVWEKHWQPLLERIERELW